MKKFILFVLLPVSGLLQADDGIYAINQSCKDWGCFAGDAVGFPITISQPGSYRLTSNLVTTFVNTNVIEITSSNVTIDLNGFAIIGPRTCTGYGLLTLPSTDPLSCTNAGMTSDGINGSNSVDSIVIKNGTVKGFDSGIAILGGAQRGNMVINVIAEENEEGILIANGIIKDSQANRNIDRGFGSIATGNENGGLIVKDSSAYGNFGWSAYAHVCSNVFFRDNGITNSNSGGDSQCTYYTNNSYCQVPTANCVN